MQRVLGKMRLKAATGIVLTALLMGMSTLAFNIQPVKASGTIYITSDYTFTHNIYEPIVVLADSIVIDGNGYTLQGTGGIDSKGMNLTGRSNITIKNMEIKAFYNGIYLHSSSNNTISGNNIKNNFNGGIDLFYCSNNSIYHNNFVNNTYYWVVSTLPNAWDNGYPSGGNYWSNYTGVDVKSGPYQNETGSDGIGDTPHVIHENNQDNYPLMYPWSPPYEVTIKAYCYTESTYVSVNITMDGTPTGYTTPHTFTDLTGTHTFTVPSNDPNGHPFKQWSTGQTSTTITVSSSGTYTAYYEALPVGGIWVPVDKLGLLAPYIALASTIIVATVAIAIYVKRRKKKQ